MLRVVEPVAVSVADASPEPATQWKRLRRESPLDTLTCHATYLPSYCSVQVPPSRLLPSPTETGAAMSFSRTGGSAAA